MVDNNQLFDESANSVPWPADQVGQVASEESDIRLSYLWTCNICDGFFIAPTPWTELIRNLPEQEFDFGNWPKTIEVVTMGLPAGPDIFEFEPEEEADDESLQLTIARKRADQNVADRPCGCDYHRQDR